MGIFIVSVVTIVSIPSAGTLTYAPQSCYITPQLNCVQALIMTNSISTQFITMLDNNVGTGIKFASANAFVVVPSYLSSTSYGGTCTPQDASPGALITCTATIPSSFTIGTQLNPRFSLSYQVCSPSCGGQVYNTSGEAVSAAVPYRELLFMVHLATSPATGGISIDGVDYANGANVVWVYGIKHQVYAVLPSGPYAFGSWSHGSNITLSGSTQSATAFGTGTDTLTASFVQLQSSSTTTYVSSSTTTYVSSSSSTTTIGPTYVQLTLTNSQGSATAAPFQQMISFAASSYSSYESSNLGNIRFYTGPNGGGTELYSWCESGCTSSSGSTVFWIKLPNGIGASSSVNVYMTFEPTSVQYDANYAGEAPQLSGTYGQYDNGANVFTFYDNFAGTALDSKWVAGGTLTYSVNDGLTVSGNTGSNAGVLSSGFTTGAGSVVDFYGDPWSPSIWWIAAGVFYSVNNQFSGMLYIASSGYSLPNGQGIYGMQVNSPGAGATGTGILMYSSNPGNGLWSVTLLGSSSEYQYNYGSPITVSSSAPPLPGNVGVGVAGTTTGSGFFMQYMRVRAEPPNGVMPSVAFGSPQ